MNSNILTRGAARNQSDWVIESDTHSDFLHPSQLELTIEQSKSEIISKIDDFEDRNDLSNNDRILPQTT